VLGFALSFILDGDVISGTSLQVSVSVAYHISKEIASCCQVRIQVPLNLACEEH